MMQHQLEKRLGDLRPGALFTTRNGIMAVKTAYIHDSGQCKCVRLEDGQSPHFSEGDMTPVREVELVEGRAVDTPPEHEHTFTLAASHHNILRMCPTCGTTWLFNFTRERWDTIKEAEEQEQFFQELRRYPLLLDWLAELGRQVEDVRTLSMNKQVIRDTKREAQEASGWHVQKLGETMTVSLVFADYSLETRDFKQEGWIRLTEPEESPFHSTVERTVERLERLLKERGTITEHDIKEAITKIMPPKDKE
jgi:hypothetical protein